MTPVVDASLYTAFLLAAFVRCVTPGPDMRFIVAMGGRGGPSAGVMAAFGVACAMFVHAVAAALGLSAKIAGLLRRSRRVARGPNVFSGTVFTGLAVRPAAAPK
ncbi:hypothetical protein [Streptomyces antimycoticus]|uniref:hypothetical protein n=1 Tax=Streptomyces antimycoticus TaxID=68175 RepID=UPI001424A89B